MATTLARTALLLVLCPALSAPAGAADNRDGGAEPERIVNRPALPTPAWIPFDTDGAGAVVVAIRAGGQAWRFLLDTGANMTAVSPAFAKALTLEALGSITAASAANSTTVPVVRLERLTIGTRSAGPLRVTVQALDALHAAGLEVDGVLGQDALSRFDYTLDYRRRRLEWDAPDPGVVPDGALRLEWREGRFLVELPQAGREEVVELVLDSGSSVLLLRETPHRRTSLLFDDHGPIVRVESMHGPALARRVTVRRLDVGPQTLRNVPSVLVESASADPSHGDGLLPLGLFSRVRVHGTARYVVLEQ